MITPIRVSACCPTCKPTPPGCTTRPARRTRRSRGCGPSRWPGRADAGRSAAASPDWAGSRRRRSAPADRGSARQAPEPEPAGTGGGRGDQSPPVRPVFPRRWPATGAARFRRVGLQPVHHGQHPQPARLLAGRVSQRERRRQHPGQHLRPAGLGRRPRHAIGRGGNRTATPPRSAHRPLPARDRRWRASVVSCSLTGSYRVLAEQDARRLSGGNPPPVVRPARCVRAAGVEGQHPAITSWVTGFRYRCVVDRCAWPSTHCTSRQRDLRVPGHPIGRRVAKIVQRPVRPQRGGGAGEHRPGRVIGQRPERSPQRPPQRLVPPGRHQPASCA